MAQVLKYLPMEKAQDARHFIESLQYWQGGNPQNLENLILSTCSNYVPALKGVKFDVSRGFPPTWHLPPWISRSQAPFWALFLITHLQQRTRLRTYSQRSHSCPAVDHWERIKLRFPSTVWVLRIRGQTAWFLQGSVELGM